MCVCMIVLIMYIIFTGVFFTMFIVNDEIFNKTYCAQLSRILICYPQNIKVMLTEDFAILFLICEQTPFYNKVKIFPQGFPTEKKA